MKVARHRAAIALAWLALPCAQAQKLRFTAKDDITMTRISNPRAIPSEPGSNEAWPSPSGRWVAIVTSRGVLSSDKIESNILLFNLRAAQEVFKHPADPTPLPKIIASVSAFSYRLATEAHVPVITDLRWSDDKTLYFKAVGVKGNYQLCSATIDGHGFRTLTPDGKDVGQFDIAGRTIVYTAADPGIHLIDPGQRINRDAIDITGARIQEILFPDDIAARSTELFRLFRLKRDKSGSIVHETKGYRVLDIPVLLNVYPFRVSPNAKQLIKLEPPSSIPQSWTRYEPVNGRKQLHLTYGNDRRALRADNVLRPLEYTLIDLASGRRRPLLNAPNARSLGYGSDANLVAWSRNGRRVLVTNTFLPIASQIDNDSSTNYPCAAASVDLLTFQARCLYFEKGSSGLSVFHIQDVAFGHSSDDVRVLLHDASGQQIVRQYDLQDAGWTVTSTETLKSPVRTLSDLAQQRDQDRPELKVFIRQSLNDPPSLWMRSAKGEQSELWNPNPQFQYMQFGEASYYDWKDETGRVWSAVLVKPVGYTVGRRYPLVLQMYGYVKGQFITDGLYPTAFAARELANAGFVVLQIQKQPDTVSEEDPKIALAGYRSAVAQLSAAGMIDPQRVGVVGFSWTSWYAIYALVHDPGLFAAATIADGLDNSYMQYKLFTVEYYPLQRQMDAIRGGGPWDAHLQHWVDAASEFHLDRVQAPVRIEAINPSSVLQEWGLYASLRLLRKPVDFIYFPDGTHIHQRPLERLESQQGDVDWFCFWLKNEEDSSPSKRAQYARWEQMRSAERAHSPNHTNAAP